ncbi:hypothetical protein [Thermococcus sp. P6]|uniref:hypothetical protein n=1 Tax=Thermococcus sp. P6 TaxID=122420 RepID=UPI0018DFFFE8|nr:hypothetical protein [Thermococcus sp. P6]
MKALFSIILTLSLASLILVGSSGTFVSFDASREVKVDVVPGDNGYLGLECVDLVESQNTGSDFELTVRNHLSGMESIEVSLDPDYSRLPAGIIVFIETEDGARRTLSYGEEYTFTGHVETGNAPPGEYFVPITMYAHWEDGDAVVETCQIKLVVRGSPTIEKVLLSGNTSGIPMKTYQEWTFQILVTNPTDNELSFTVKDTIPAELNVSSGGTAASAGTYTFSEAGHSGRSATKMEWNVTVPAGGSAHVNVTVFTRVNHGGQQEFTSCGSYNLNDGAILVGYGITSNSLVVTVDCPSERRGNRCFNHENQTGEMEK